MKREELVRKDQRTGLYQGPANERPERAVLPDDKTAAEKGSEPTVKAKNTNAAKKEDK